MDPLDVVMIRVESNGDVDPTCKFKFTGGSSLTFKGLPIKGVVKFCDNICKYVENEKVKSGECSLAESHVGAKDRGNTNVVGVEYVDFMTHVLHAPCWQRPVNCVTVPETSRACAF